MEKIARVNLSELIAEKIKNDIIKGKLQPRERLPTREELCQKWGVSRVALREALKKLETMGIVEIHQGRGTFVRKACEEIFQNTFIFQSMLGRETILALLEARKVIETELARFAAQRVTDEEFARLEEILTQMEKNVDDDDSLEFAVRDFQFHKQIGILAKNEVLFLMFEKIQTLIQDQQREMFGYGKGSVSLQNSLNDHRKIYAMLQNRDAEGAAMKMKEHITYMEKRIREHTKNGMDGGSSE